MADNASEMVKAFSLAEFRKTDQQDEHEESSSDENDEYEDAECDLEENLQSMPVSPDEGQPLDVDVEEIAQGIEDWAGTKMQRLGCNAHALHLVVTECIKKNTRAAEIKTRINKLISFFNYSNRNTAELMRKQNLKLIKPGDTRWNSLLYCLQRISKVCKFK